MSVMPLLPSSPRARRRLAWTGGLSLAAAGLVALIVALPKGSNPQTTAVAGGGRIVTTTREEVPLAAADRKAINATLTAFVKTAVVRKHVAASYELATPALRSGHTRAEWATGKIPVFPYAARSESYGGWRLKYSYPGDVGFDLLLHPRAGSELGPVSFAVEMKRLHGRWLVDSFAPTAVFSPAGARPSITAAPDFGPQQVGGSSESRFNRLWLIVPAALLGLAFLVPLVLVLLKRERGYRPGRGELPPLPAAHGRERLGPLGAPDGASSRDRLAQAGSHRLE
jgi:hypothetical protein